MHTTDRSLVKLAEEEYDGLPSDVSHGKNSVTLVNCWCYSSTT